MSKKGNETLQTIVVAGLLCLVCSLLVSVTVVTLKPKQIKNKEIDMKKNILVAAGLIQASASVAEIEDEFSKIETVIVDLETGEPTDSVDAKSYDQNKAAADPAQNVKIPSDKDFGGLSTRAKYAKIYVAKDEEGKVKELILPVKGKGLWSTMYGFIAVESDTTTIKGFAYYSQGETPGLGGEVDNPNWKKQWIGKKLYDEDWNVAFEVAKGTVDSTTANAEHKVDGLSGATITGNGVTTSMKYWFSDHGFGKYLANLRQGEN